MKFSTVLLAATASAAVVERSNGDIVKVLASVQSGVEKLDSAANSYNGDKAPLIKASDALIQTIKDGKTKVDATGKLSPLEGTELVQPTNELNDEAKKLVKDLTSKRDQVEKAGECDTVREKLQAISSNSQALIKAVVAKVPESLSDIAAGLSKKVTDTLNEAADAFSEANCKNSGGDGGDNTSKPSGGDKTTSAPGGDQTSTPAGGDQTSTPAGATTSCPPGGATETSMVVGPSGTPPVVAGAASFAPAAALAAVAAAFAL